MVPQIFRQMVGRLSPLDGWLCVRSGSNVFWKLNRTVRPHCVAASVTRPRLLALDPRLKSGLVVLCGVLVITLLIQVRV